MPGMRIKKDFKFASDQFHNLNRWRLLSLLGFYFHFSALFYYCSSSSAFVGFDFAIHGEDGLFLFRM